MMFEDKEDTMGTAKVRSKDKMPETPNFEQEMVMPKRQNPFVFDNWGGSSAANATKP